MWNFNAPPVNMNALGSLRRGMSQQQVEQILGGPTSKYESGKDWAYERTLGWSIVYVYFDERGQFKEHVYDY